MKVMVFPKRSLKKEVIVQSNLLKRKGKVKISTMVITGLIVVSIVFLVTVLPSLPDK